MKTDNMKTFITINGTTLIITKRATLEEAIKSAENISDHSKEIIVREVTKITDYTKVYENQPALWPQMQDIIYDALDKYDNDPLIARFGKAFINELKKLEGYKL